jgi:hypothetical protein
MNVAFALTSTFRDLFSRVIPRSHNVRERPPPDSEAGFQAIFIRRPEVNAAVHATKRRLIRCLEEATELPNNAGQGVRSGGESNSRGSIEKRQHGGGCSTECTVTRDVLWKRGSNNKRFPIGIGLRCWISIDAALSDRSDRTPEIVVVFGTHAPMAASAMATFNRAKRRAFCCKVFPRAMATF